MRTPQAIVRDLAIAMGLVAAATLFRVAMGWISPSVTPFAGYYVAALGATILCGWRYGALAVALGGAAAWFFFLAPISDTPLLRLGTPISVAVYLISGATIVAMAESTRRLVASLRGSRGALADRNLQYDSLFERMSEGFALCEVIRDAEGRLTDYVILEINPTLQRMLAVGPEVVGTTYVGGSPGQDAWLAVCDRAMHTGAERFEYRYAPSGRTYEIRISRVGERRMAQFFFDITARKIAEGRQTQLFEELNHRVKNNLALVAGLLELQARTASPTVRDALTKAGDRVHSIAQVHQALYLGTRQDAVDFGAYLKDLTASLAQSIAADGRITLDVEAEAEELPIDTAVPLGMVVNELVTNAVKHAYPPPQTGLVSVRFRREGDRLKLAVGDGGCGLPETPKSDSRGGGLGMRLVESLVTQVHAELVIKRSPGATFEITLPAAGPSNLETTDRRLL
jgi:two-component sensor histidine kinase